MNDRPTPAPESAEDQAIVAHLMAVLDQVRAMLAHHLRRLQAAGRLPAPGQPLSGWYIDPATIEARLTAAPTTSPDAAILSQLEQAQQRRLAIESSHPDVPLLRIYRRFGLSEPDYLLLCLALSGELDVSLGPMFAYLQNHFERQYATLGLLAELLEEDGAAIGVRSLVEPDDPLVKYRLVEVLDGKDGVSTLHRPLCVDRRIVRYAMGDGGLDPRLRTVARLELRAAREPVLDETRRGALAGLVSLAADLRERPWELPVMLIRGPQGAGRRGFVHAVAASQGQPLLLARLQELRHDGDGQRLVRELVREAVLQDAVLAFEGWERALDSESEDPDRGRRAAMVDRASVLSRVLDDVLAAHPGAVAFVLDDDDEVPAPELSRACVSITLGLPDAAAATVLWERHVPETARGPELDLRRLAGDFRLTPGQIERAAGSAIRAAHTGGESGTRVTWAGMCEAIREQVRHRLGETATLVRSHGRWEDLVVPEEVSFQLEDLKSRVRLSARVFDDWGFGRRFGPHHGISVVFEGPSGTGKTMAAALIAGDLGLDLYQIDLSRTVSKYIGETEKNLARIFDEAERAAVMLLFDEADSLFSKRTSVESSNDRYANLEVNYLLQRVERFTGLAVLTTNFPASLDEAFKRRLSMRIHFPQPTAELRRRLWESMLDNPAVPLGEIDLDILAEEFELSGGQIRNAVLRAAFVAASRDRPIDHELLSFAALIEQKEQGMLVLGSPYRDLRDHLDGSQ